MVRSKSDWVDILNATDAKADAKRILGDLTHYFTGRAYEADDIEQLANALEAYAALKLADSKLAEG